MGRELEIKYSFSRRETFEAFREILYRQFPGEWETVTMESCYYDTEDRWLNERQWTLRVRQENDKSVLSVKTPGQGRSRGEWEAPEAYLPDGLLNLVRLGAPEEILELRARKLRPTCGARFVRQRKTVELPDFKTELALDRGTLLGGSKELPFAEVEVELRGGDQEAFERWCRQLEKTYGLREEPLSKFVRAFALQEI